MLLTLALATLRHEDCELEARLSYIAEHYLQRMFAHPHYCASGLLGTLSLKYLKGRWERYITWISTQHLMEILKHKFYCSHSQMETFEEGRNLGTMTKTEMTVDGGTAFWITVPWSQDSRCLCFVLHDCWCINSLFFLRWGLTCSPGPPGTHYVN